MSNAMLVAATVAGLALATSAIAEPFGAGRPREGSLEPSPRAGAEQRHDFWEGRHRLDEQRNRRRRPPAAQGSFPGQNATGYPGQTPYGYGAANGGYGYGGGYSGDYSNPPPHPAPPPSPRGLHNGLWYY